MRNSIAQNIALLFLVCMVVSASGQISLNKDANKPQRNDQAASILRQMVDAYARMPALRLRSEYTSTMVSLKPEIAKATLASAESASKGTDATATKPPVPAASADALDDDVADDSPHRRIDRTVELLYVQPNLLKITDASTKAKGPKDISTWACDGKTFCAFVPRSHGTDQLLYTQEKAPHNIRGFSRLQNLDGSSLELVMLMGINPFQNLNSEVAAVSVDDPAIVRGVKTDVVTMNTTTRIERIALHLYIGKEDHLLYRFISDITPLNSLSGGVKIGDALDELADGAQPDSPPALGSDPDHPLEIGDTRTGSRTEPKRTRTVYDNIMTPITNVDKVEFAFTPPDGAGLFVPAGSKQVIDPNAKRLADIIRKSMEGHSKPLHDVTPVHDVSP